MSSQPLSSLGSHCPGKEQESGPRGGGQAALFPRLRAKEPRLQASSSSHSSPSFPGPSHQAHSRAEAELPQELPLQKEDPEASQNEPLTSAKQHKKAKKRKSLGAPELPPVANIVSAPSENLGLEREWQSLAFPFPPALWTPDMG